MAGLRVHRIKDACRVLGPGVRAVVWFQGCSLNCPGCIADEMNRSRDFEPWSPGALAERLIGIDGIEGVTLSGGDPFDQPPAALAEFLETIRRRSTLSVMCYTGRTLHELLDHPREEMHRRILSGIDLLIDGRYVEELNDGSLWRGSSNQKLWFLTDRYRGLADRLRDAAGREIEIELSRENRLTIAGIPPRGFMTTLQRRLAERGLELVASRGAPPSLHAETPRENP